MLDEDAQPRIDDRLQEREELRARGEPIDAEALAAGLSEADRAEFFERLRRIEAAEREVEAGLLGAFGGDGDGDGLCALEPRGVEGRYVQPTLRGRGGMGDLCAAHDVELERTVAYKVMRPPRGPARAAIDQFENEARITSQLNHPGIVPVYGRVVDGSGRPAYASAFVSGESLARRIAAYRAIDPQDQEARARARGSLLSAFLATCEVVAYAHSQGVVHGDVKPLNIMADDFGATRLIDWGLARVLSDAERQGRDEDVRDDKPSPVARPGTEEFRSSPTGLTTRSGDVYALGVTLASILSGAEDRRTPAPDTPPALWAVAMRAVGNDRSRRYPTPEALADDVRAVLDDRAIAAYRDPWPTRLRRWAGRHRAIAAASAALLLAVAVGGPLMGVRERTLRQRADASRTHAERLTSAMLDQVEHIGRFQLTLPGSRSILDGALRLVEQQARAAEASGAGLDQAAGIYLRAGRIQGTLGRLAAAEASYDQAAKLAGQVGGASGRVLEAQALRDRGVVRFQLERVEEAKADWQRALQTIEPVASQSPEARLAHARILYALGNERMMSSEQPAARALYDRARAAILPVADISGQDATPIRALADIESNRGFSLFQDSVTPELKVTDASRLAEAKAAHAEALRLRRRALELSPGDPERTADVAASLNHLANASQAEATPAARGEAAEAYREAASLLDTLARAYPAVESLRLELGQVESNLGVLLASLERRDEALAVSRSAVERLEPLASQPSATADLRMNLGAMLTQLAERQAESGQAAAANDTRYRAAVVLAETASMAGDASRREPIEAEVVRLLADLAGAGYFNDTDRAARLRDEHRLDPLRGRPDFPKP
jgi:serine/threonine-protein kinase